ncbi:precorrin 6A synthase [Rhodobacterales bacterium HTCC2654]|uniref:Precorrin 6A synthase n=1 Tax=Maritimibacter alkaliphilus HTCC2654 TaxID=314271 RepID=A3VGH9_9RHOB|nr:precorrin 6A synthase [Rhodobacterales bacterium HTCC2654] [Maritimibacter alkaliphilus HTCC2654]
MRSHRTTASHPSPGAARCVGRSCGRPQARLSAIADGSPDSGSRRYWSRLASRR